MNPGKKYMNAKEEYRMILAEFKDYKKHGHLQLRFSLSNIETLAQLQEDGFTVTPVKVQGNMIYDIVGPVHK